MPNSSAIRNWLSNVNVNIGFLSDVLMEIGNFEDIDKYYCLILDSMSIKKEVHLEKASNRYSLLFITLYYIGHFETLILLII